MILNPYLFQRQSFDAEISKKDGHQIRPLSRLVSKHISLSIVHIILWISQPSEPPLKRPAIVTFN